MGVLFQIKRVKLSRLEIIKDDSELAYLEKNNNHSHFVGLQKKNGLKVSGSYNNNHFHFIG